MRYLTIKRHKAYAGCMGKMKVYIEDPMQPEMDINGVPCRKLGELKNGEEKVFEIGNNAAKVFVIAGKMSRNWCSDFFQLYEGADNIWLSGKNRFNPASGNAFRFDNNDLNPEVQANRKKGSGIGIVILIAAVAIGSVAGYFLADMMISDNDNEIKSSGSSNYQFNIPTNAVTPNYNIDTPVTPNTSNLKYFTENNMSIMLPDDFTESTIDGFTTAYTTDEVAVLVLEEPFSTLTGLDIYSARDYAEIVISNYGISSKVETDGQHTWFDYSTEFSGETVFVRSYVYYTSESMWMLQFCIRQGYESEYLSQADSWARTVLFG